MYADNLFDDRLKSQVIQVIQSGPAVLKGRRRFTDGNMALLKGMEFNKHTAVNKLLRIEPVITTVPGDLLQVVHIADGQIKEFEPGRGGCCGGAGGNCNTAGAVDYG